MLIRAKETKMFVYCGAQLPLILILIGMNILSTNCNIIHTQRQEDIAWHGVSCKS